MRFIVDLLNSKAGPSVDRLGDHSITRFLKRHPAVATTVARAMDQDRVLASNQESLQLFFKRLYMVIHRNHIGPDDMWNFDEKGFMMGLGRSRMN